MILRRRRKRRRKRRRITIIINLIYLAQYHTSSILTALNIVIH